MERWPIAIFASFAHNFRQICNEALYKSFVAHRLNRLGQYQPLFTGSAPLVRPEQMVQWLWHGTRGTDPAALYESLNGFNCGFSGDTLMFGHGNYFSTASSYSVGSMRLKSRSNSKSQRD